MAEIRTIRTFKYRIYPTRSQIRALNDHLDLCCELYNAALQERRDAWRLQGIRIRYLDQQAQLPAIKRDRPELVAVYGLVLRDPLRRLDRAFQAFFRRVKAGERPGFPRFRSRRRYNSFTYLQDGFGFKDGKLALSKIGRIKIKQHRELTEKVKTLTIVRTPTGKWFACFTAEVSTGYLPPVPGAVGVDVGLTTFATLSTGEAITNPRFLRFGARALARSQQKKRRKAAARIHERIKNCRHDFAHQLSRALVSRFGMVAFENLNVKGMVRNRRLSKSIHDAAWSQLVQFTIYKAESAGRTVCLVDPRNTSKRCSGCGATVEKTLADRVHSCACGLVLDRDHNAAINILTLGLQSLGLRASEAA